MKIKTVTQLLLSLSLASTAFMAKADFKSEIIESCTQYQKNDGGPIVNACKLYIDGFIDASMQYDASELIEDKSDFIKRVYRTRTMSGELTKSEDAKAFCIPVNQSRTVIASEIAKSLDLSSYDQDGLRSVVHHSLVQEYPC